MLRSMLYAVRLYSLYTELSKQRLHMQMHITYSNIAYVRVHVAEPKVSQLMGTSCMSSKVNDFTCSRTQVAKLQALPQAYLVVTPFWSPDTVVGGLEQTICPPLQAIANVDCDAPLYGVKGGPMLRCWHCIPDIANLLQIWIFVNILAGSNL